MKKNRQNKANGRAARAGSAEIGSSSEELDQFVLTTIARYEEESSEEDQERLNKEKYKQKLASELFKDNVKFKDLYFVSDGENKIFFKDNGIIEVGDNRLTAIFMTTEQSSERLIDGAIAQGWESVTLEGNYEFFRLAAERALNNNIKVKALNKTQQKILDEITERRGKRETKLVIEPLLKDALLCNKKGDPEKKTGSLDGRLNTFRDENQCRNPLRRKNKP